jgi:hypothetical protein
VVAQDDPAGRQHLRLPGDELGEGPLDRLAVDVAPTGGREDGHVRPQVAEDPRPVAGGVLVQQAAVGGVDQVDERTAVPPVALQRGEEVLQRRLRQAGGEVRPERLEAGLLLLPADPEVAEALLAGVVHLGVRPHAGVLAGEDVDAHVVGQCHGLPAGHGDRLVRGHAGLGHDPHGLVAADDRGAGPPGDPLGAVQVVEV